MAFDKLTDFAAAFELAFGLSLAAALARCTGGRSTSYQAIANALARYPIVQRAWMEAPEGQAVEAIAKALRTLAWTEMQVVADGPDDDDPPPPRAGALRGRETAALDFLLYIVAHDRVDRRTRNQRDGGGYGCDPAARTPRGATSGTLDRFQADALFTLIWERRGSVCRAARVALLGDDDPPSGQRLRFALRLGVDQALSHGERARRSFNADFNRAVRDGVRGVAQARKSGTGWEIGPVEREQVGLVDAPFRVPLTMSLAAPRRDALSPFILTTRDGAGRTRNIAATDIVRIGGAPDHLVVTIAGERHDVPAGTWFEVETVRLAGGLQVQGEAASVQVARASTLVRVVHGGESFLIQAGRSRVGRAWTYDELLDAARHLSLGVVQLKPGARVVRGKDAFLLLLQHLVAKSPYRPIRLTDARTVCWQRSIWQEPGASTMGTPWVDEPETADGDDLPKGWRDTRREHEVVSTLDVVERTRDRILELRSAGVSDDELAHDPAIRALVERLCVIQPEGSTRRVTARVVVRAILDDEGDAVRS